MIGMVHLFQKFTFPFPSSGKAQADKKLLTPQGISYAYVFPFPSSGKAHSDLYEAKTRHAEAEGFHSLQAGRHIQTQGYGHDDVVDSMFPFPSSGKAQADV